MLREPPRMAPRICTIDVTGLAAVMLALVALFAIPGAIPHPYRLNVVAVDLSIVSHAVPMRGALKEDALIIAVTRDGTIFTDEGKVRDAEQLPTRIRERLKEGTERKVYLKVDARARYGAVLTALAGIRAAGVEDVAFFVIERQPTRSLPDDD